MTWPREESRPRINQDSRRVGLLTLVLGGLVIAGLLVMLIPIEEGPRSGRLYCGTPLSAAFKSPRDYLTEPHLPLGKPRRYVDYLPTPGTPDAAAACVSDGRTRTTIGAAVLAVALLGGAAAFVATRRSRAQRDG